MATVLSIGCDHTRILASQVVSVKGAVHNGYEDYKDVFMPTVLSGRKFYEQGLENYLLITTLHELGITPDE